MHVNEKKYRNKKHTNEKSMRMKTSIRMESM